MSRRTVVHPREMLHVELAGLERTAKPALSCNTEMQLDKMKITRTDEPRGGAILQDGAMTF